MGSFSFNRFIILESLNADDEKTGTELLEYLSNWINLVHKNLKIEYVQINGRNDFFDFFDNLYNEVSEHNISPLIHFEAHGTKDKSGISLTNQECVSFREFGGCLRKINEACGCNLFITLAVCHGLHSLFEIHPTATMPFCGALGSFDELYEYDLKIRFHKFYEEFFNSINLNEAYKKLLDANGKFDADYRCYMVDELFMKSYKGYLENDCSSEGIERRAKECFDSSYPWDLKTFTSLFKQEELKKRDEDYINFRDNFFITKKFPQNIERFNLPNTTNELLERCRKYGW